MRLAWKPVLLAVLAALPFLLLAPLSTVRPAFAEITSDLEAEDTVLGDGDFTSVTFSVDPDEGDVRVELRNVANTSDVVLAVVDCDFCDELFSSIEDNGSLTLSIESGMTGDVELLISTECADEDPFRIVVSQDGDSDEINLECDPDEIGSFDDGDPLNSEVAGFPSGTSTTVTFLAIRDGGAIVIDASSPDAENVNLKLQRCETSRRQRLDCADADSTRDTVVIEPTLVEEGDDDENDDLFQIVMNLSAFCDYGAQYVLVTAEQIDGASAEMLVACLASPNVTIIKEVRHIDDDFKFEIDIKDGDCYTNDKYKRIKDGDTFSLKDGDDMELICSVPGYYTVTEKLDDQYQYAIECEVNGGSTITGFYGSEIANINRNAVDIKLSTFANVNDPDIFVTCIFTNTRDRLIAPDQAANLTDTLPPTSQLPLSSVTFFSSATTLNCNGSATVVAMVKDPMGMAAPDGTVVAFASSSGSLMTNTATTRGGQASVLFVASNKENDKATITASAGTVYGTMEIESCLKQVAGIVAPRPPVAISPPSTGDAGLLVESSGARVPVELAAVVLLASGIGLYTLARKLA